MIEAQTVMAKEIDMQTVLRELDISQREVGRAAQISKTAINRLVLRNVWPQRGRDQVRGRVLDFLSQRGAKPEQLAAVAALADTQDTTPAADSPAAQPEQEESMLLRNEPLTAEAKQHFGLARSPFLDDIATRADVFASPGTRRARAALMDAALNHGFVALIGESGSGKTTLREELEQRILDEQRPVIVIKPYVLEMEPNEQRGRPMKSGQISEAIITTLAPTTMMRSAPQARAKQVHELLAASQAAGYSHLLIIEEAHRMPMATLKHLKGFMELKRGMQRLLGVALIGQPELRTLLNEQNPQIREIVQRCEQVELGPLDSDLEGYLKHKFERMGLQAGDVFAADAFDALRARLVRIPRGAKASDGISMCYPLVVNNLVCRAMNAAARVSYPRVDAQVIAGC